MSFAVWLALGAGGDPAAVGRGPHVFEHPSMFDKNLPKRVAP
jgi:hypothetical protein